MTNNIKEIKKLKTIAKKYSPNSETIPVLRYAQIKNNSLSFTDLETYLTITDFLKAEEIECLVPSVLFIELLETFGEEPFWMEHFENTSQLEINKYNAAYKISTLPLYEFPEFPVVFNNNDAVLTQKDLNNLYEAVKFTYQKDDCWPQFHGVHLNHSIYATDKKKEFNAEIDAKIDFKAIIPKSAIDKLKIFNPESVTVCSSLHWGYLRFEFDNKILITRLIKER